MLSETKALYGAGRPALGLALSRIGERDGLLALVLAAYAAALLLTASGTQPDTWLAIVGGREVIHGLPTSDHLTIMSAGARWVDQQWLAQLTFYFAYQAGGLLLVGLMNAAFAFLAVVAAATVARWRGADMRATVWIAAIAMIPFLLPAEVARTQTLALPLFVGVVWLLIRDSVRPSRQVLLTLPLLALWTNIHGSVLVAIVLVALHGAWSLRTRRAVGSVLVVGSLTSVFASPYATGLPHYYRTTVLNSSFKVLNEWGPTTLKLETIPLFVLLFAAAYLYGRASRQFTFTEAIVILVCAGAALHAIRFTVWFALAALMVLPRPLSTILHTQTPPVHLNRLCARLGVGTAVGVTAILLLKGVAGFPSAASGAVASAAGGRSPVFSSELYSDWLLTKIPALRGRVAYDSRIELLSAPEVSRVQFAKSLGIGAHELARKYPVFVLNAADDRNLVATLRKDGYASRYKHDSLLVLAR
jgi:hypothetical protein